MMEGFSAGVLASEYVKARAEREALDEKAKEAKAKEDELKARLIQEMTANSMPSMKLDGLGRFSLRQVAQYSVTDENLLCRAMMARMVANAKAGRPWADGLMLQKRPAKTTIEELMESGEFGVGALASMGLSQSTKFDLSFTRQK